MGVHVIGDYAYVTALNNDSISIVNITNKSNPVRTGSLSLSGSGDSGYLNWCFLPVFLRKFFLCCVPS